MEAVADHKINALLTQAGHFRHAASVTVSPDYRAKMLKAARQLEAKAAEIEADLPDAPQTGQAQRDRGSPTMLRLRPQL